jgi:hypothetical protein
MISGRGWYSSGLLENELVYPKFRAEHCVPSETELFWATSYCISRKGAHGTKYGMFNGRGTIAPGDNKLLAPFVFS